MNQAFLLNTERTVSTNKVGESVQGLKRSSDMKSNEQQAFSSELEKHVEKKKESGLESTGPAKNKKLLQKDPVTRDENRRQIEESEYKNGKLLPEGDLFVETVKLDDVQQEGVLAESDNVLSQEEFNVEDIIKSVDGEPLELNAKPVIIEGLPAQVSLSSSSKDKLGLDANKELGEKVSSLMKNMPKQDGVIYPEKKFDLDNVEQGAEQRKVATNIRTDILQAISQRTESKVDDKNTNESIGLKAIASAEKVIGTDKKAEGQFELTDIVKQIKSETSGVGKPTLDKGPSSFVSTLVSPINSHTINSPTTTSPERVGVPLLDIQPEVQSKAWGKVLSSRVVWMAQEGIQQAALRLNPASLGSIEVKLSLQNEQVNISFIAQHVATRDALEQALPRLRESLGDNGLELANADVSQQESFEHADDNTKDSENLHLDGEDGVVGSGSEKELLAPSESDGTISVFA